MDDTDAIDEELQILEERVRPPTTVSSESFLQPIRALLKPQTLESLSPSASVAEAIARMQRRRVGALLVVEGTRLVGIVTERDVLLKASGESAKASAGPVSAVMTPNPDYLMADDQIAYLLNAMRVGGFRHVPIVDDSGQPTHVVSLRDVLAYIVDNFPEEVINIPSRPFRGTPNEYGG